MEQFRDDMVSKLDALRAVVEYREQKLLKLLEGVCV